MQQSKRLLSIDECGSKIARNSVSDCHLSPVWRQMAIENSDSNDFLSTFVDSRDQARGRRGRNSRPRGRNFALNGTQGEVGVSLKKIYIYFFFFFFFRETHLHSVTTQMQAVVTLSDNLLPLHHVSPSIKWQ